MNPGNIPRLEEIGINGTVLGFTFGVSLAIGILFGLAPAWRALKVDLNTSLKAGGRSGQSEGGLHVTRGRLRGLLVVSELALSLILLIGAGLLIRSFVRLGNVPPGFNPDGVLTFQVVASGPKYRKPEPVVQFYREIEGRIARLPGVRSEGAVSPLPLTGGVGWGQINVEGYVRASGPGIAGGFAGCRGGLFPGHGDSPTAGTILLAARYAGFAAGGHHRREVRAAVLAA